jgi:integrase/recombinase XerD
MLMQRGLKEYVALRRVTGFNFRDGEGRLRSFVRFAKARGEPRVRGETVIAWASQAKRQATCHRRLRMVTRFAEFLRAEDPRHELPPQNVFCPRAVRPAAHIFSRDDISRIVACAAQLGPKRSFRALAYGTLFGLLAVTGLRSTEARSLRLQDVTADGLVVRETKFRKSRIVPLHETTKAALHRYISARRRVAAESDYLFLSQHRRKLGRRIVLDTFREVCARAGIGLTANGTRPRVHDLRHTFAVHALEMCPHGRDRVEKHMIALTTYLGHARIESTYWYLESTPRLLKDIAAACEAIAPGSAG